MFTFGFILFFSLNADAALYPAGRVWKDTGALGKTKTEDRRNKISVKIFNLTVENNEILVPQSRRIYLRFSYTAA